MRSNSASRSCCALTAASRLAAAGGGASDGFVGEALTTVVTGSPSRGCELLALPGASSDGASLGGGCCDDSRSTSCGAGGFGGGGSTDFEMPALPPLGRICPALY